MSASSDRAGGGARHDRLILVGRITGAYGVKGEARVASFTEDPPALFGYAPFTHDRGGVLTPSSKPRALKPGVFAVRFRELPDREAVLAARGDLWTPRSRLPATADGDEYYVEDLVGLRAVTPTGEDFGRIAAVHNFGAGDLLEVKGAPGVKGTILIPFTKEAAPTVDLAAGAITIIWTDGS